VGTTWISTIEVGARLAWGAVTGSPEAAVGGRDSTVGKAAPVPAEAQEDAAKTATRLTAAYRACRSIQKKRRDFIYYSYSYKYMILFFRVFLRHRIRFIKGKSVISKNSRFTLTVVKSYAILGLIQ